MKHELVIGDIHGANKALVEVIEKAKEKWEEKRKWIFLGDYVDGWGESCEVIDTLIELSNKEECIFILGNHDLWCREWLRGRGTQDIWITQGGQATFDSYIINNPGKSTDPKHLEFFENLKLYHIDDDNRGFVHGGFKSKLGLGNDVSHEYYWNRDLANLINKGRTIEYLDPRMEKHKEIYIGHTATNYWDEDPNLDFKYSKPQNPIVTPMNYKNLWNIDTGAGWDGKLTCMEINTKEFVQSDFTKNYYPNEKGR